MLFAQLMCLGFSVLFSPILYLGGNAAIKTLYMPNCTYIPVSLVVVRVPALSLRPSPC